VQLSYAIDDATPFVAFSAGSAAQVSIGYGRIQPDPGRALPSGLAIQAFRRAGVLVSEASIPASQPIKSGRVFAETGPNVNTGVAFANPNDEAATISFHFTDAAGITAEEADRRFLK
jgi:hypothetical protein